jgi:hypothetical protein
MTDQQKLLTDIFLQPWFMPQRTAYRIRDLLPDAHRHKMRYYFDDYGCLQCGKKQVRYGSNGMCKLCCQHVKLKVLFAIKRRWRASNPTADPPRTFRRAAEARKLLADLRPPKATHVFIHTKKFQKEIDKNTQKG